jgi:hypothetical protein
MKWAQFSLRLQNVSWADLVSVAFIVYFFQHFLHLGRFAASVDTVTILFRSMTSTAISSVKFAVADCVEIDRSKLYSRCNSGPRHRFALRLIGSGVQESSVSATGRVVDGDVTPHTTY